MTSQVLHAMLGGNFKEASESEISFDDFPAHIAKQMLDFIHYDRCPLLEGPSKSCRNTTRKKKITDILQLYAAADKYDIRVSPCTLVGAA